MFVAALLIISQIWKKPKCPSTIVCIKSVYSYSGIFYNEINTLKLDAATQFQTLNTIFFFFAIPHDMEKAMATHSSTLTWKIPWTEGPGRLQSMRSLGVGHD